MKPRVLLFLAGQLRTFDSPEVMASWNKLFSEFEVTVVGCFWENRGSSAYKEPGMPFTHEGEIISTNQCSEVFKSKHIRLYDYSSFINSLPSHFLPYRQLPLFDCIISNSFVRWQCKDLFLSLCDSDAYDSCIITRPDLVFLQNPRSLLTGVHDSIFHQNCDPIFYRDRVYDIFLVSNLNHTLSFLDFYFNSCAVPSIESPLHNGLVKMDSCRVYYNYLNLLNIQNKSTDRIIADVFRQPSDINSYMSSYNKGENLWGLT